jgi:hypothetical protein
MNKKNILDFEDFLNTYKNKGVALYVKHLFPISLDSELSIEYAYLIGKVMGDGNLDDKYTLRFIGQEEDLFLLRDLIIKRLSIKKEQVSIRKKEAYGISYTLQVNCAYLGRILSLLGAPIGNKTKSKFEIPNWIIKSKNHLKIFLNALLEDELTTIKIDKCNYAIKPRFKMAKKENLLPNLRYFLGQIKSSIESFGIECSHISEPVKGTKTKELYFFLNRKKINIIRFQENIGFRLNQDKIKELNKCSEILRRTL